MADFLSHILFAQEVMDEVKHLKFKELVSDNIKIFNLGAQGPDIFFYYKYLTYFLKHDNAKIGSILHQYKTGDFLRYGIQTAKNKFDTKEGKELFVYMLGYICHFYLDKNIHPYVNYCDKCGVYSCDRKVIKTTHPKLESYIDIINIKEKKKKSAVKEKSYLYITEKPFSKTIAVFYKRALEELYNINVDQQDMTRLPVYIYNAQKIYYDPHRIKGRIVEALRIKLSKCFYKKDIDKSIDWMNKNKNEWYNLSHPNKKHNESVYDIWEVAKGECIEKLNKLLNNVDSDENLNELFTNISYLTNLECEKY